MNSDADGMVVARNQFWSWDMLAFWPDRWTPEVRSRKSFFLARNALYHGLGLLDIQPASEVLVPAYICRAAVDPLLARGIDVIFYNIRTDCSPDLDDIRRRITSRTRAIVLVHYFGFPRAPKAIRELCDNCQLILIEDCAHVLAGEVEGHSLGSFGDAAIFSWRKFLPIYDGADLVLNRPVREERIEWVKESPLFTLKVASNMLDVRLAQSRRGFARLAHRGVRLGSARLGAHARRCRRDSDDSEMMRAESSGSEFDRNSVNWPMSRLSRWTWKHSNVGHVVARRRRNYNTLLRTFKACERVVPLFQDLPPTICPWVFPVMIPGVPRAHTLLRERGIPAVTWGGVRHPSVLEGVFPDSDRLYDDLIFLPVHQSLQDKDMELVATGVEAVSAG